MYKTSRMFRLGQWSVARGEGLTFESDNGTRLNAGDPALVADGVTHKAGPGWTVEQMREGALRYTSPGVCRMDLTLGSGPGPEWVRIGLEVANLSDRPMAVQSVLPVAGGVLERDGGFDRLYSHGMDLCGLSAFSMPETEQHSHCCAGFTTASGDEAVVAGFDDLREAFHDIVFRTADGAVTLDCLCRREGVPLAPGAVLVISGLLLGAGPSLADLMDGYARAVAGIMGARNGSARTGWCSWYYYYGTETEDDILANVEALADSPLRDHVQVIQIDDGWNVPGPIGPARPHEPRVWGDWFPGGKFPHGMGNMARRIKERGFAPGLWLAPFSVEKASELFKSHPDWMVQGEDGPAVYWGVHALDLTRDEVLDWLRETFVRVFDTWGFDYVKLDFLLHAIQPGRRHDPSMTTARAFRRAMGVIRDTAGDDRFVLNCGAPMGPSVGLCDGMRIGYDVSSRWHVPMSSWPQGNCNIRAAAFQVYGRQWMHRAWWQNDPDCVVVRDHGTDAEKRMFSSFDKHLGEIAMPYGLSLEEAAFWVRMVWMAGGMALVSENMRELSGERLALLRKAFPVNPDRARWVDHYARPELFVLRSDGGRARVGVFNVSDEPCRLELPAAKLGLRGAWTFRERLSDETFSGLGESVRFPRQPGRSGRVWELQ